MDTKNSTVTVKTIPLHLTKSQGDTFFREMLKYINIDHPRLVLDCSNLQILDKFTVLFLLCVLEEAMKHNGDVKLVALPNSNTSLSDISSIYRLFDIYRTTDEAVDSFHRPHGSAFLLKSAPSISSIETDTNSH